MAKIYNFIGIYHKIAYFCVDVKLMQIWVPNGIVDHSNSNSNGFGQQLWYETDSNKDFESTIIKFA